MGTQITEPTLAATIDRDDILDIDNKTTVLNKGLAEISISNWNNASQPTITAGSIYDINGTFYAEGTNATVSSWSATGTRYLYATASGSSTSWSSSASAPSWSAALQGYYNGTSARAFYIVISGVKYKMDTQNQKYNSGSMYDLTVDNDLSVGNDATITGNTFYSEPMIRLSTGTGPFALDGNYYEDDIFDIIYPIIGPYGSGKRLHVSGSLSLGFGSSTITIYFPAYVSTTTTPAVVFHGGRLRFNGETDSGGSGTMFEWDMSSISFNGTTHTNSYKATIGW